MSAWGCVDVRDRLGLGIDARFTKRRRGDEGLIEPPRDGQEGVVGPASVVTCSKGSGLVETGSTIASAASVVRNDDITQRVMSGNGSDKQHELNLGNGFTWPFIDKSKSTSVQWRTRSGTVSLWQGSAASLRSRVLGCSASEPAMQGPRGFRGPSCDAQETTPS